MTKRECTYKEWTNDETWITYSFLMQDRPTRWRWHARAFQLVGEDAGAPEVNQAIQQLATELRDAVTSECSNHATTLSDNLLNSALERVVWREVAKIIVSAKIPAAAAFDYLFPFGSIVETVGVLRRIPREERLMAVAQHAIGDWGEIDGVDWSENEYALKNGDRLYSEYFSKAGGTFLVITAGDRSVTTLLLSEEY